MIKMNSSFSKTKIKYLCTSLSIPLDKESLEENGKYPVYGASGIIGMMSYYQRNTPYLGIIKDGAGVGRIGKYPAFTSLLGTLSYILPNDGIDIDWLMYAIKSLNLNQSLDKTTIPHIYFSDYGNKKINVCSLILQKKIATFLNSKCSQIDSLIADITKEIELLKEYRKSVIYEAVTKGLDPNVEMKDSGIKWIGNIPKDWNISKFKYAHSGLNVGEPIDKKYWSNDSSDSVFYTAGLYPIMSSYNNFPLLKKTTLQDLLMARNGTPYVYLPNAEALYTDHIIRAKIKKAWDRRYLFYCFQQSIETEVVDTVSITTWSASIWNNQFIPAPNIEMQILISNFLDSKCSEIDSVISEKEQQIDKLNEYRKSLIYEYVTGKKEVPTV